MSDSHISGKLTTETKEKVLKSLDDVMVLLPFLLSLTADERKKLRKIGPDRLGYATEVNIASNANSSALASGFKMADYNEALDLFRALTDVDAKLTTFKDAMDNTLMALGAELMKKSDEAYGYLKIAAEKNNDQNLNSTIKKIIDMLKTGKHVKKA
jgi:hypothetical protein